MWNCVYHFRHPPAVYQIFLAIIDSHLQLFGTFSFKVNKNALSSGSLACLEINFIVSWCWYATFSFRIQNECCMS